MQYLQKLINTFYKDDYDKLLATSLPINMALPMAKRTTPLNDNNKRKRGRLIGSMQMEVKH